MPKQNPSGKPPSQPGRRLPAGGSPIALFRADHRSAHGRHRDWVAAHAVVEDDTQLMADLGQHSNRIATEERIVEGGGKYRPSDKRRKRLRQREPAIR